MSAAALRRLQNIARIQHVLDALYPQPPVPLNSRDTYTFLLAVVLSAQTTDGKVNEVTTELFERAPTPEAMSRLSPAEVESMIKSVGLAPKKAVYLVELSKKLVSDFNSVVPATYAELESLPGVGHKTASVLMSQSFGHPALAVDTHVHRLANRWGLSAQKNVDLVQKDLMETFPRECWNKLHLQMIYFGREFCTAKEHTPANCPICSFVHSTKKLPDLSEITSATLRRNFTAAKKSKGIVYYHDRTDQLKTEAHLVMGTPSPVAPPVKARVTKRQLDDVAVKLETVEFGGSATGVTNPADTSATAAGGRKRARKAGSASFDCVAPPAKSGARGRSCSKVGVAASASDDQPGGGVLDVFVSSEQRMASLRTRGSKKDDTEVTERVSSKSCDVQDQKVIKKTMQKRKPARSS